ncbi:MAG: DUF5041 domain-containing protein [Bacteroidales bacterium]|nr:DUF5041 domain-containing protein [Bacteroidales bacterium]
MKHYILTLALLLSCAFAGAQEIRPVKADVSDYVPMLQDAGFGIYAFDISSLNDNAYNISLVVSEYVNGELVSETESYEVESSLYKNPQKLTLGFSPKSDSMRNVRLYVDDVRVAAKTLSLKPMTAPQYEGEIMYDLLSFELDQIKVNAVTPLVLLGSYWYDEPFKTVRFYGDEDRTILMSSPIMKLIPHCYVLGIRVEQQYKTYNAVPTQPKTNTSIPLTGGAHK